MGPPPPVSQYKLNFDGASKGNPGPTGFGGAIRNSEGVPVGIYWGYIGLNSNNMAELRGLLEGLRMATSHGWMPLILEGDSQVILQMATKLINGKKVRKVTENWKMNFSLEELQTLLRHHSEVQIHYVRRKAKKIAIWWQIMEFGNDRSSSKQQWTNQMEGYFRKNCLMILE